MGVERPCETVREGRSDGLRGHRGRATDGGGPESVGDEVGVAVVFHQAGDAVERRAIDWHDPTGEWQLVALDESLGLNCAWYADILLTLTADVPAPSALQPQPIA